MLDQSGAGFGDLNQIEASSVFKCSQPRVIRRSPVVHSSVTELTKSAARPISAASPVEAAGPVIWDGTY
jgi:hypothetical protein